MPTSSSGSDPGAAAGISQGSIAIRTEALGKQYLIGHERFQQRTLIETIASIPRWRSSVRVEKETFWALRDIDLEIHEGEIVGIIGRNGSGKSTLLKILAKITAPTTGRAVIRGRVGSLLEVGTGFHPELTGRENVYLNGAILGMRREEIRRKFDAIIEFAEVERFLDTPIKRYSSGMYVRLAFSVAAHLEPEILLVDEVLAVGDAEFQKRCLGKIGEVARQGRTVLFVSHNLPTIAVLTTRCVWIDQGKIAADATTQDVIERYLNALETFRSQALGSRTDRTGSGALRFVDFSLRNGKNERIGHAISGDDLILAFRYVTPDPATLGQVDVSISFLGPGEQRLFHLSTRLSQSLTRLPREGTVLCRIPRLPLQPGSYAFTLHCETDAGIADRVEHAGDIEVSPGNFFRSGKLPRPTHGTFLVDHSWALESDG